jgi:hypothetical protein
VDAYLLAQEHMQQISGQVFNLGGGPRTPARTGSSTWRRR